MIDLLVHHSDVVEPRGDSYRLKRPRPQLRLTGLRRRTMTTKGSIFSRCQGRREAIDRRCYLSTKPLTAMSAFHVKHSPTGTTAPPAADTEAPQFTLATCGVSVR
jgi:hypothetical protein